MAFFGLFGLRNFQCKVKFFVQVHFFLQPLELLLCNLLHLLIIIRGMCTPSLRSLFEITKKLWPFLARLFWDKKSSYCHDSGVVVVVGGGGGGVTKL